MSQMYQTRGLLEQLIQFFAQTSTHQTSNAAIAGLLNVVSNTLRQEVTDHNRQIPLTDMHFSCRCEIKFKHNLTPTEVAFANAEMTGQLPTEACNRKFGEILDFINEDLPCRIQALRGIQGVPPVNAGDGTECCFYLDDTWIITHTKIYFYVVANYTIETMLEQFRQSLALYDLEAEEGWIAQLTNFVYHEPK